MTDERLEELRAAMAESPVGAYATELLAALDLDEGIQTATVAQAHLFRLEYHTVLKDVDTLPVTLPLPRCIDHGHHPQLNTPTAASTKPSAASKVQNSLESKRDHLAVERELAKRGTTVGRK